MQRKNLLRPAVSAGPAGIVVLEPLPPAREPRLRAFIWCGRRPGRSALPKTWAKLGPRPVALMVGRLRLDGAEDVPGETGSDG